MKLKLMLTLVLTALAVLVDVGEASPAMTDPIMTSSTWIVRDLPPVTTTTLNPACIVNVPFHCDPPPKKRNPEKEN